MYIHNMYVYVCMYVYIYIYMYGELTIISHANISEEIIVFLCRTTCARGVKLKDFS